MLQIKEMLEKARRFNSENDITGCLLFYNGEFIQYLEGNQVKVLQLYDKIQNDLRHTNVTLLHHGEIFEREFENWDMAFEFLRSENSHLQYLKLLVSTFIDDSDTSLSLNPTSKLFWRTTKMLLETKKTTGHF